VFEEVHGWVDDSAGGLVAKKRIESKHRRDD
jgi:hypothetical protein